MTELGDLIRAGAAHAGVQITAEHADELSALQSLVGQARDGDVVAIMAHQDRAEIDDWLLKSEQPDPPPNSAPRFAARGPAAPRVQHAQCPGALAVRDLT